VVAERENVGAGSEQPVGEPRRDPRSVGDVLAVDDAEVDVELVAERPEPFLDRAPSRRPEDVGDEKDLQGIESVAAGWSESATWLPASCVYRLSA
jgi:hypothetical protein